MGRPVRGLRPVDAFRFVTEKVPNPTRRTSSPRFNAPEIVSKTDSTALPASVRLRPVASATEQISSCLFMPVGTPKLDVDGDSPGAEAGLSEGALATCQTASSTNREETRRVGKGWEGKSRTRG